MRSRVSAELAEVGLRAGDDPVFRYGAVELTARVAPRRIDGGAFSLSVLGSGGSVEATATGGTEFEVKITLQLDDSRRAPLVAGSGRDVYGVGASEGEE